MLVTQAAESILGLIPETGRVQRRAVTSVKRSSQERVGEGMGTEPGPGRCTGLGWPIGGGGLSRDNTHKARKQKKQVITTARDT